MNRLFRRSSFVLAVVVLGVALAAALTAHAAPSRPSHGPTLAAAEAAPGSAAISGVGFTPGSEVFVSIYDPRGLRPAVRTWATASETVYGPGGSQDPARGFVAAGAIRADFDGVCGDALMARAYDPTAHAWSSGVDVPFSACSVVHVPDDGSARAASEIALLTGFGRPSR